MSMLKKTLANLVLGASLAATPYLAQAPSVSYAAQQAQAGTIDPQPAANGARNIQEVWIPYHNSRNEAMISAPDVYLAGQTGSDELLESFRVDYYDNLLVTSTRVVYAYKTLTGLNGIIVHNFKSTVVTPTENEVIIPVYETGTELSKVLGTAEGLSYLRALFDTRDSAEVIAKTLQRLSGKPINKIKVWSPNQEERADDIPEAPVGVIYRSADDTFYIDDGNHGGRSRGVSVK